VALRSRVRKPPAIFWLAAAFVTSSAVTLLWTISPDETVQRIQTYAQLLGSVWIFQEFVRTQEQHESLLFAFCLSPLVPVANLMNNFVHGRQAARFVERYTSGGLLYINADGLALILVMAIPMALYLMHRRGGFVRLVTLAYVVFGSLSVLLTGTGGAVVGAIAGLAIVPLTQRQSLHSLFRSGLLLIVVAAITVPIVPSSLWTRILTIQDEVLGGGSLSGRRD